jgi:hypothetical protein
MSVIWGIGEAEYFLVLDWTDQISLRSFGNFDFARNGIRSSNRRLLRPARASTRAIHRFTQKTPLAKMMGCRVQPGNDKVTGALSFDFRRRRFFPSPTLASLRFGLPSPPLRGWEG